MMAAGEGSNKIFALVRFALLGFDSRSKDQYYSEIVGLGGIECSLNDSKCTHVIVFDLVHDDNDCVVARNNGKTLVTELWVDDCIRRGTLVDDKRVLYKPVKDLNGIPESQSLTMCLTGYQRQDRDDIMKLVSLMGARFSKFFTANQVTHLICYKFEGEKFELARKMNIKLVNHHWLENCLSAWKILPIEGYLEGSTKTTSEEEIQEAPKTTFEEEIQEAPKTTSEEEIQDASDHSSSTQTNVGLQSGIGRQETSSTLIAIGDIEPDVRQLYGRCVFNRKLFFSALILVMVDMVVCMGIYFTSMKGRNFSNGVYFCMVTLCSIGYGDIHPQNNISKILIMLLASFSVVVMYVVSKSFGNILKVLFNYLLDKMPQQVKKFYLQVGVRFWRELVVVVLLIITAMLPWVFLALFARQYEHCNFLDCFYMAMITLATIGYGDMYFKSSLGRLILSVVLLPYVLIFQHAIQNLVCCIANWWFEPVEESKIYEQIGVEEAKASANDFVVRTLLKERQISLSKIRKMHASFKKTH